jgi:hypothetical protein
MSHEEVQGSVETVPKDMRQLRACLVCSLIKTFDQVGTLVLDSQRKFFCIRISIFTFHSQLYV